MPSNAQSELLRLVGLPFQEGARGPDSYDCLGITLFAAQLYGLPTFDPWEGIRERWQDGERDFGMFSGFPEGWGEIENPWHALPKDVAIFNVASEVAVPGHIGFVDEDLHVLSSRHGVGVYRTPAHDLIPRMIQLWRYVA